MSTPRLLYRAKPTSSQGIGNLRRQRTNILIHQSHAVTSITVDVVSLASIKVWMAGNAMYGSHSVVLEHGGHG
jgi:hypothetical protein